MAPTKAEITKRLEDEITELIENPPDPAEAIAGRFEELIGKPVGAKIEGDHVTLTWEEEIVEVKFRVDG